MTMTVASQKLRIALMGTRGIPARYGGFETFAEELATRLVQRGHKVSVYGRRLFGRRERAQSHFKGVEVVLTPTIMHKYLETPLHAFFSFLHLFCRKYDVVLLCNAANSPFAWLVKLRNIPLVINVDGIERKRGKWNVLGRLWYRLGEICSVLFATRVVGDAKVIADYYKRAYGCTSEVIAYGATASHQSPGEMLRKFNLEPDNYLLYVSRLEPENNARGVIKAYKGLRTNLPLVIVGDAPYAQEYIAELKKIATPQVIFTGFQFGAAYQELRSHCRLYIQATEVGGTHPALVEGMAYGNCIIANQTAEHVEVLEDTGVFYHYNNFDHLREKLQELLDNPSDVVHYRQLAQERAAKYYQWDTVCEQYEQLFYEVMK